MAHLKLNIAAISCLLAFAGCSEPAVKDSNNGPIVIDGADMDAPDEGASLEPIVVVDGEVSIAASVVVEVQRAGGQTAEAGETMVIVPVQIANGLGEAIPVGFTLFRLRVDALERLPSAASAELETACPVDALLSAGQTFSCIVAFSIPEGGSVSSLIFQAPPGAVEDDVTLRTCDRCDGYCVDLQTDDSHCGACNQPVPSSGGECVDGVPGCPDGEYECDGACERNSTTCWLTSPRRTACSTLCEGEGLVCEQVEYFYECDESTYDAHPTAGCDDGPPLMLDGCGTYRDQDCRCKP